MSDVEPTRLSTIAWVITTSALFILLARWSTGGSWGITSGIVDGVRGWSRQGRSSRGTDGPGGLPPLDLAGARRPDDRPAASHLEATVDAQAEIDELPPRRI